ncbi:MAG: hypothetical protein C0174_03270 [Thermodesulfobium narugense]|nr:MAG: hypothetical protein C0174_03270 [Thermodesulfobium narugense]
MFGYVFLQLSFLKWLTNFVTTLGFVGILYMSSSFDLTCKYTKVVLYRIFAFANPIAQIIPLFLLLFSEVMGELTAYILFLAIFLSLYIILMIAFYTTPTKMREDESIYVPSKKNP